MVHVKLSNLFITAIAGLASISCVASLPVEGDLDDSARSLSTRGASAAPHFVIYTDASSGSTGPPPVAQVKGYNVVALSFLLGSGPADKAMEWTQLSASQRSTVKSQYAAAGIKLIVSLFGSTEQPTTGGADPTQTANTMAAWVKKYDLDGVDVDYEDFPAMDGGSGSGENWLIAFTKALRKQLPQGSYILTHAPSAPWFVPNRWGGGGYLKVHSAVGNLIDWYNVQYYNQGTNEYTTCNGLLHTSSSSWPKSAVFQIAASGVPLSKLVIGKPGIASDASNGFTSPSTLASCVSQAKSQGWNGGVMVWQFPHAGAPWIQTVRGSAFPL